MSQGAISGWSNGLGSEGSPQNLAPLITGIFQLSAKSLER